MRNVLLIAISLFYSITAFGQISTTKVAKEVPSVLESYDSLENFLGRSFHPYLGQELYVIPKSESLRKYGYSGFLNNYRKDPYEKSNTYRCNENFASDYNALAGKYFEVLNIIETNSPYEAFFKLKFKESDQTLYFKYQSKFKHTFPFLVIGHYEKQKQIFISKDILLRPFPKTDHPERKRWLNIVTGEEMILNKGEYYHCLDVTISEKYFETSLLLINNKKEKFLFPLYARSLDKRRIFLKSEVEDYLTRFGEGNWDTILDEKVKVGFTEEMTRVSWGEPDRINRASYRDQWVYGKQYLYFEKGKLTSFN